MGEDILTAPPVSGLADAIGRRWNHRSRQISPAHWPTRRTLLLPHTSDGIYFQFPRLLRPYSLHFPPSFLFLFSFRRGSFTCWSIWMHPSCSLHPQEKEKRNFSHFASHHHHQPRQEFFFHLLNSTYFLMSPGIISSIHIGSSSCRSPSSPMYTRWDSFHLAHHQPTSHRVFLID